MDWPDYVTRELIEADLAERRAEAARLRLLEAHGEKRPPLRVIAGRTLIRLGSLIAAEAP